jgi:hypothetical protein
MSLFALIAASVGKWDGLSFATLPARCLSPQVHAAWFNAGPWTVNKKTAMMGRSVMDIDRTRPRVSGPKLNISLKTH